MNYNPYAAPQAGPPPAPATPGAGSPQPWEIGEVLGQAWEIFKAQWAPLVGSFFIAAIFIILPSIIHTGIMLADGSYGHQQPLDPEYLMATSGSSLASQVISAFFEGGLIRIYLAAARGQQPGIGDLFSGASKFLPIVAARLLLGLIYLAGFMCLFVPAVIAYCGLWMTTYYVVDAGLGPIEAMKESWRATTGQKGNIFLFMLLGWLIGASGICACYFGMLVTVPILLVAMSIVFLRISGRGAPPPALPPHAVPPGGYAPPGGGYGAPPAGGGYGGPPGGGGYGPQGGGGYGGPQGGGYGPQGGGGYGGPQGGGGGYGGPQGGGGGYGPPGGGGYGGPQGGGGGYGPPGGGGYGPPGR